MDSEMWLSRGRQRSISKDEEHRWQQPEVKDEEISSNKNHL